MFSVVKWGRIVFWFKYLLCNRLWRNGLACIQSVVSDSLSWSGVVDQNEEGSNITLLMPGLEAQGLWDPMSCSPPSFSVHRDFPDKNIGMGCHTLLQGIFPTQGSNPGLPHCRQILYVWPPAKLSRDGDCWFIQSNDNNVVITHSAQRRC